MLEEPLIKNEDEKGHEQTEWKEVPPSYTVIDHEKDKGCSKYCYPKHYQKYFDVSTKEVTKRILRSMLPILPGSMYGNNEKLDMYGPLWTMICLFVSIPIFGNVSNYLDAWKAGKLDSYKSNIEALWSVMF